MPPPVEEAICSMMARSLGVLGAANRWWRIVPPGVGSNSVVASSVSQTTTSLCFDIPNAAKAAEELAEQGLTTDWWDEAFNRQARVEGPYGAISFNEEMDDTYGYKVTEPIGPSVVDVVATVYTPEFEGRPTSSTTLDTGLTEATHPAGDHYGPTQPAASSGSTNPSSHRRSTKTRRQNLDSKHSSPWPSWPSVCDRLDTRLRT
jgi:hypothetical protein